MRIAKQNVGHYHDRNAEFNREARILVSNIFQTDSIGSIPYVHARNRLNETLGWETVAEGSAPLEHEVKPPLPLANHIDLTDLPSYERTILTALAWGQFKTYVLAGDMGSGKTTTVKYLVQRLNAEKHSQCGLCASCKPIVVHVDFNLGHNAENPKEALEAFYRELSEQLRTQLRFFFASTPGANAKSPEKSLVNRFRDTLRSGWKERRYAAFDQFLQQTDEDGQWQQQAEQYRINRLFSYIERSRAEHSGRVELLTTLIHFIKVYVRPDPACCVIVYDNLDSVVPEAQYDILKAIFSIQEIGTARALVAVRKATFERLNSSAAYSFGVIHHAGPELREVARRRLENHLKRFDTDPMTVALSTEYREAVRRRIELILHWDGDDRSPLKRVASLCGSSVRLGLFMCERMFINDSVPWEGPRYADDLVRAVLVAGSEVGEIDPRDRCVFNLIAHPDSGRFSMLPLRIVQLTIALRRYGSMRRVGLLARVLSAVGKWSTAEIRLALNSLLFVRRPLLWIDARSKFNTDQDVIESDDVLYVTEAGYSYLKDVVRDLVYMQEAFMSVSWEAGAVPAAVDFASMRARLKALLDCIKVLVKQDRIEVEAWRASEYCGAEVIDFEPVLIANTILTGIAESVRRIVMSSATIDQELLKDWLSVLIDAMNAQESIGRTYPRLSELIATYERLVKPVATGSETS